MAAEEALEQFARALGVPALDSEEQQLVLDLARDVAHGSQRRFAPLSAFLLGAASAGAGDRSNAMARGVSALREVLERTGGDPPAH